MTIARPAGNGQAMSDAEEAIAVTRDERLWSSRTRKCQTVWVGPEAAHRSFMASSSSVIPCGVHPRRTLVRGVSSDHVRELPRMGSARTAHWLR